MKPGADVESFGVQAIWGSLGSRWGEAAQNMLARRTLTDPWPQPPREEIETTKHKNVGKNRLIQRGQRVGSQLEAAPVLDKTLERCMLATM